MYEDSLYNLMNQLLQEQKSLWRIQNFYLPQAADTEEEKFWQDLGADKMDHVEELERMIKERM